MEYQPKHLGDLELNLQRSFKNAGSASRLLFRGALYLWILGGIVWAATAASRQTQGQATPPPSPPTIVDASLATDSVSPLPTASAGVRVGQITPSVTPSGKVPNPVATNPTLQALPSTLRFTATPTELHGPGIVTYFIEFRAGSAITSLLLTTHYPYGGRRKEIPICSRSGTAESRYPCPSQELGDHETSFVIRDLAAGETILVVVSVEFKQASSRVISNHAEATWGTNSLVEGVDIVQRTG